VNVIRSLCIGLAAGATLLTFAAQPAAARERTYFIAADEVLWNYAPSGRDLVAGRPLPPPVPGQLGFRFHKLEYRGYTDATFARLRPYTGDERYLGILGPVLRAEVGDTVTVVFKNNSHKPVDIAPSGGLVGPLSYLVAPGAMHTYRWSVPESAGPAPMDDSSVLWTYESNGASFHGAMMAGLRGPIVVTRRGAAAANGSPKDVDREVFAGFLETDEATSSLFSQNLTDPRTNPRKVPMAAAKIPFANAIVSINGFNYGNMPIVSLRRGERVRWYVFSSNSNGDFHAPTWNGGTLTVAGNRMDTVGLSPGGHVVADMVPDDPGLWLLYCTLNIHLDLGMKARYRVTM
jgi:FtsP/CotA-like multicopper oxidase with cupredoxin domain